MKSCACQGEYTGDQAGDISSYLQCTKGSEAILSFAVPVFVLQRVFPCLLCSDYDTGISYNGIRRLDGLSSSHAARSVAGPGFIHLRGHQGDLETRSDVL